MIRTPRRAAIALAACLALPALAAAQVSIYVSPTTGNDGGSGQIGSPFRTLGRARAAVRALQPLTQSVKIVLREGTFYLDQEDPAYNPDKTLHLSAALGDSGTATHAITWSAHPGESVLISGGRVLGGFGMGASQVNYSQNWSCAVPGSWGSFTSRDLYHDGLRLTPARHPNYGWCTIKSINNTTLSLEVDMCPGSALPPGSNVQNPFAEVVARRRFVSPRQKMVSWSALPGGVASITLAGPFGATLACATPNPVPWYNNNIVLQGDVPSSYDGDHVYFENAQNWMDVAHEWHFNPTVGTNGTVALRLPVVGGVSMPVGEIIAPVLEQLLTLTAVQNVHFSGISFAHTNRPTMPNSEYYNALTGGVSASPDCSLAGDLLLTPAVHFKGTVNCSMVACRIGHTGGTGVSIESVDSASGECNAPAALAQNNQIRGTEVYDTGGNGIVIGTSLRPGCGPLDAGKWVEATTIRDCYVHDFGRVYHDAIGIYTRRTKSTTIQDNEVAYGPMTGIQSGVQYEPNPSQNQVVNFMHNSVIAGNNIHHVMEMLDDGAGIYTVGGDTAGLMERNWVHDINHDPTFTTAAVKIAAGIYFDNNSGGWNIRRNFIERTATPVIFNVNAEVWQSAFTFGTNCFDHLYPLCSTGTSSPCLINGYWLHGTARYVDPRMPLHEGSWITVPPRTFGP